MCLVVNFFTTKAQRRHEEHGGGLEYFIGRKIALEPKVTYTFYKQLIEIGRGYKTNNTIKMLDVGIGGKGVY